MPVIVRHTNRVFAARVFIDNVLDAAGDQLYIGIGRTSSNPWTNESAPPTPQNTKDDDNGFWSTLLGIGKVSQANATMHGKQKIVWTSGDTYLPVTDTIDKSDVSSGNQFYVVAPTTNRIYTCVSNNGGSAVSFEPEHTSGTDDPGDGYQWKYEYAAADVPGWGTLETLNWMPVPDDGTDESIAFVLGANYVLVGLTFPDYANTGNIILNEEYRQIALLKNPKLSGGADATADWVAATSLENIGGDVSDNVVLTLDNRIKITRTEGQSETVVAVLEF